MNLKKITPEQALDAIRAGQKIYVIREASSDMTVLDLMTEDLAVKEEETEPAPETEQESQEKRGGGTAKTENRLGKG